LYSRNNVLPCSSTARLRAKLPRGKLFLARLPATRDVAEESGGVLAGKAQRQSERDRLHNRLLRKHGWRVLRIWEHALTPKFAMRTLRRLVKMLGS
jgi:hypothetical protein